MQNILIVDDVDINRKLIKKILLKAQLDVIIFEAVNGEEALELIRNNEFCVVILDIMMPDIDGLHVLSEIKLMPNRKDAAIIMCSAIHQIDSVERALEMGALDYFTKPLSPEQIRITLPLKIKNAMEFYIQKRQLIAYNDRFREDMQVAEGLQKSMIKEYSQFESISVYGKYIPCVEIGGDMFATKKVENKVWFMIADISGHGIAAGMIATMIKVVFNATVNNCILPSDILYSINRVLHDSFERLSCPLISAFVGYIEEDILYYANAGHPYPIVIRSSYSETEELNQTGFLLGLFEETLYESHQSTFLKDDVIILYTDGLYDYGKAYKNQSIITVKEYCEFYKSTLNHSYEQFIQDMINFFKNQEIEGFDDDVAVMCIVK